MQWSKRELQRLPKEGIEGKLELSFSAEDIPTYTGIRRIERCGVVYQIQFDAYAQHVILRLSLEGTMVVPCSISFADVILPFDADTTHVYALEAESGLESELDFIDDGLNLKDACITQMWMQVPAQVISPDLKTLPKGQDWEVLDEYSYQQRKHSTIDPRLEKLMAYQPEDEEEV